MITLNDPLCFTCGWLPKETIIVPYSKLIFDVCDRCWGYKELQPSESPYVCAKCLNRGKVLNSIGKEVAELVRDIIRKA